MFVPYLMPEENGRLSRLKMVMAMDEDEGENENEKLIRFSLLFELRMDRELVLSKLSAQDGGALRIAHSYIHSAHPSFRCT